MNVALVLLYGLSRNAAHLIYIWTLFRVHNPGPPSTSMSEASSLSPSEETCNHITQNRQESPTAHRQPTSDIVWSALASMRGRFVSRCGLERGGDKTLSNFFKTLAKYVRACRMRRAEVTRGLFGATEVACNFELHKWLL
jgi:hypothetical protein